MDDADSRDSYFWNLGTKQRWHVQIELLGRVRPTNKYPFVSMATKVAEFGKLSPEILPSVGRSSQRKEFVGRENDDGIMLAPSL